MGSISILGTLDDWMKRGYVDVMSRNVDVLNLGAYRLLSGKLSELHTQSLPELLICNVGAIEQAILSRPPVAECCVDGILDELKAKLLFAFSTLSVTPYPKSAVHDTNITSGI